jgi:hypothetical protein
MHFATYLTTMWLCLFLLRFINIAMGIGTYGQELETPLITWVLVSAFTSILNFTSGFPIILSAYFTTSLRTWFFLPLLVLHASCLIILNYAIFLDKCRPFAFNLLTHICLDDLSAQLDRNPYGTSMAGFALIFSCLVLRYLNQNSSKDHQNP